MKTFNMEATLSFKAVVPDAFLLTMREQAKADDATPFLRAAQEAHPTDDDEFLLVILRNGVKRNLRQSIVNLMASSGIGGTFSPVSMKSRAKLPDVQPVLASELNKDIPV